MRMQELAAKHVHAFAIFVQIVQDLWHCSTIIKKTQKCRIIGVIEQKLEIRI